MHGLDPRIHADWPQIDGSAEWIAGGQPGNDACDDAIQFDRNPL